MVTKQANVIHDDLIRLINDDTFGCLPNAQLQTAATTTLNNIKNQVLLRCYHIRANQDRPTRLQPGCKPRRSAPSKQNSPTAACFPAHLLKTD